MDRELKILTVGEHSLILKAGLIGREEREISKAFGGQQMEVGAEGEISGVDVDKLTEALDVAIHVIVVSFDGHKDGDTIEGTDKPFNILDAILDLPVAQYHDVLTAVNAVVSGKDFLVSSKG